MGNYDRNSCCLWTADKVFAFPATNSLGFGVYENRGVWSETKARYMCRHDNIT